MRRNHHLGQVLLAEFLLQRLHFGFRQKPPPDQKKIGRTANENGGGNRREIKEANALTRSLAEKVAHDDVAAGADQRPLTTERRAVSGAEQVARRREVALFAHPQNDRHENEDNRRLIDEHRKGGGDRTVPRSEEEFVVSTGPEQAPTDHFGDTGADHGSAKHKHGRDHDHRHAAKAGERLLRAQDG